MPGDYELVTLLYPDLSHVVVEGIKRRGVNNVRHFGSLPTGKKSTVSINEMNR